METCKNCRHWSPLSLSHMLARTQVQSQTRGKCEMADCSVSDSSPHKDDVPKDYFAVEIDGDTYGVNWDFVTGPDFGCIRFEGKK